MGTVFPQEIMRGRERPNSKRLRSDWKNTGLDADADSYYYVNVTVKRGKANTHTHTHTPPIMSSTQSFINALYLVVERKFCRVALPLSEARQRYKAKVAKWNTRGLWLPPKIYQCQACTQRKGPEVNKWLIMCWYRLSEMSPLSRRICRRAARGEGRGNIRRWKSDCTVTPEVQQVCALHVLKDLKRLATAIWWNASFFHGYLFSTTEYITVVLARDLFHERHVVEAAHF